MDDSLQKVILLARKAGKAILEVYQGDFSVELKADESFKEGTSPLTEADKKSNDIIIQGLKDGFPDINIISEENKEVPYSQRKEWASFWLVDPLDGTTEFIKRNGEFTVNIALIESGVPILGVVYVPVSDTLYYGSEHGGFVCVGNENSKKLPLSMPSRDKLLVVASRSHFTDETRAYVESRGKDFEIISKGSSLKLCVVAEGTADIYPRLGPTMEWDTAAAHAIANAAGKKVHLHDSEEELRYNKESLLNPWFVVE